MNYIHLENWVSYMNLGDFDKLVSMYSVKALLFATFDKQPLNTHKLIQEYFRSFFAKEESGVEMNSSSVCNTNLGDSTYSSTGLYTFFFKEGGQLIRHDARFTFIFSRFSSGPILHHHSSLIPG